jgi:protoporphyrinogen oxidase
VKLGIIGGGVLGMTLALRRAQQGDDVTLFEKNEQPGGLAVSFPVTEEGENAPHLEKYYHHIFGTDKSIIALLDELDLDGDLVWKNPFSAILSGGQINKLDGNPLTILGFKPLPFISRLRLGLGGAYLKFENNYQRLAKTTATNWIQRWMGKSVYETLWKPQLISKFGEKYSEIAMPWFWSRIHERTSALGYLKGGFHRLYLALEKRVRKEGGKIHLNADVTAIKPASDGKVSVTVNGEAHIFDKVVATVPTRLFVKMASEHIPTAYRDSYAGDKSVEHYGAHCVILALKKSLMPAYWLSVNDPNYPFLVAVEHTNFMPSSDYAGQHLLYFGNYLPHSHRYFNATDEEVIAEYLPHIKRINPEFDESWILRKWVWKVPFAQPIVTLDYATKLPPHETPIPNCYLANMAHVYPQDRGQNYSIKLAEKIAKLL